MGKREGENLCSEPMDMVLIFKLNNLNYYQNLIL